MNLLREYCKRHNADFVLGTNDGVCFFNEHKRPAIICLTSNVPKVFVSCQNCTSDKAWIAVELFGPNREDGFTIYNHQHVHPDTNLTEYVRSTVGVNHSPVPVNNNGELERWLWGFFLFHSRLRRSKRWLTFIEEQEERQEPLRTHEQMTWCAMNSPRSFNIYYTAYQALTVGRKYLLSE